jgi:chromosome condensin MukBEF MukE localization factor
MGASSVKPDLLTRAERLQYEGYLRREEVNRSIKAMKDEGLSLKGIVRRSGISRGTARKIARGIQNDVFRARESSLEASRFVSGLNDLAMVGQPVEECSRHFGIAEHR